jgi:hypothetical protein
MTELETNNVFSGFASLIDGAPPVPVRALCEEAPPIPIPTVKPTTPAELNSSSVTSPYIPLHFKINTTKIDNNPIPPLVDNPFDKEATPSIQTRQFQWSSVSFPDPTIAFKLKAQAYNFLDNSDFDRRFAALAASTLGSHIINTTISHLIYINQF